MGDVELAVATWHGLATARPWIVDLQFQDDAPAPVREVNAAVQTHTYRRHGSGEVVLDFSVAGWKRGH
jgi:hypothetical protein